MRCAKSFQICRSVIPRSTSLIYIYCTYSVDVHQLQCLCQYLLLHIYYSGAALGITDLATVLNDIFPCRAKWYNLGVQLRVDVGTLDSFKAQYGDPGDQLREVMRTWLTTSDNPTWGAMAEALESPVIGEAQLAKKLQQKHYCTGQPPVHGEWIHVILESQYDYSQRHHLMHSVNSVGRFSGLAKPTHSGHADIDNIPLGFSLPHS